MSRNRSLDILRAIAVLLVIVNHIPYEANYSAWGIILGSIKNGGWVGVDLFFILSGYLVSGLIFKEYDQHGFFDPKRFLIRRGFKIYPVYYLFIGLSTAWIYFTKHDFDINFFLSEIFFYINYTENIYKGQGLLWSICVEEHFYFLIAILFFFLFKKKLISLRSMIAIYLVFLVISTIQKCVSYITYNELVFFRDLGKSHIRFDALFFGVLISYLHFYHPTFINKVYKNQFFLLLLSLCGVLINFIGVSHTYNFLFYLVMASLNPFFFGIILLIMVKVDFHKLRVLGSIGMFSYPIYLFHAYVIGFIHNYVKNENAILILSIFFSIVIGVIISKTVEYPFLKLRDRLYPSRSVRMSQNSSVKQFNLNPQV